MKLYVKKTENKNGVKETLWVDFSHNRKRYRKPLNLENTPSNRKLAETKIMPTLQYKVMCGEFFKKPMPTVDEYMKISFELQSSNRKLFTKQDYKSKYNKHLKPIFGDKRIDTIKGTDITYWQNKMIKDGYSIGTIKSVRGILSTMFEDAVRDEVISKNPVRLVSKLSSRNKTKFIDDIESFTIEEMQNIITNCSDIQMKNFYMFLFTTGVRGGEAIGLEWENVDFKNKTININSQIGRGVISSPKWNSFRTIPIIDSLLPFLEKQFELTGKNNTYLFLNKRGTNFWDISKIRANYWTKDLLKLNISYRKIHQTRHTFCSTMISAGEDINYVSKIAGHSSTRMTLETYSKFIPNKNKDFGKIFNENF